MSLAGRACIVTGAGRGIGRSIAIRLSAAGASVVACARTLSDLEGTVALARGGRCVAHVADVSRREQVNALIERCRAEFGRIDVVVNNAGTAPLGSIETLTDDEFHSLLATNIHSVFYVCRAAWPALRESGGTIINISSLAADDPFPGFAAYGGTKSFVNTFSTALAAEGKAEGIRVFAVAPGAVETGMLRERFPDFPAAQALAPDEIAATVEWLLDDRCRYASGAVIRVKR